MAFQGRDNFQGFFVLAHALPGQRQLVMVFKPTE